MARMAPIWIAAALLCSPALARSPYIPRDAAPICVAFADSVLFYAYDWRNYDLPSDVERSHLLIRYGLATGQLEYLHDGNLPETVRCLAADRRWVYAAGNGLALYDGERGTWARSSALDGYEIDAIEADGAAVWLGTRQGVVEVDPATGEVRRSVDAGHGLNADRVWCLRRVGEALLVGTCTTASERYRGDVFGQGLNRIDLPSGDVDDVPLPVWGARDWQRQMGSLVIDIMPVAEDAVRLVLWKPWTARVFDLDPADRTVAESDARYFQLDSILRRHQADPQSELAGHLLRFFLRMDLERWWAHPAVAEALSLMHARQEQGQLDSLLSHANPRVREAAVRRLRIDDSSLQRRYLLEALEDGDAQTAQTAARKLGSGDDTTAIPALRRTLYWRRDLMRDAELPLQVGPRQEDGQVSPDLKEAFDRHQQLAPTVLKVLIDLDPQIVAEILGEEGTYYRDLLAMVLFISARTYLLQEMAMDSEEDLTRRRHALQALSWGYLGNVNYLRRLRQNAELLRFLEATAEEGADAAMRADAQRLLGAVAEGE